MSARPGQGAAGLAPAAADAVGLAGLTLVDHFFPVVHFDGDAHGVPGAILAYG